MSLQKIEYTDKLKIGTDKINLNFDFIISKAKSAYEIAKQNGFVGTEAEWLESLKADIDNESVSLEHTTFSALTNNIVSIGDLTSSTYLDGTKGTEVTSAGYKTSGYVPIDPNGYYLPAYVRSWSFYDANKVFISGVVNGDYLNIHTATHIKPPTNAAYIKISVPIEYLKKFGFLKNEYMYNLMPKYEIDSSFLNMNVSLSDLSGVTPSKNLFNQNDVTKGKYQQSTDYSIITSSTYSVSRLIKLEVGKDYTFSKVRSAIFYNSSFSPVLGIDNPSTVNAQYPYVRVSVLITNLPTVQIEQNSVATAYASYGDVKIPASMIDGEIGGGEAYDQSLNTADNVKFASIESPIISTTGTLPTGTLSSPPSNLTKGDIWADTTDSSTHPILRVMM